MGNDSSKPDLTPKTEEELPLSAIKHKGTMEVQLPHAHVFSEKELKSYDRQKRIEDRVSTQKLARFLLGVLVLSLLALYIAGFALGEGSKFTEAKEHIYPALQAALFTVLGFVFGEKVSGRESS